MPNPTQGTGRSLPRRRSRTLNLGRDGAESREERKRIPPHPRPLTRGDCENAPRPCPYMGCRHNLSADVTPIRYSETLGRYRNVTIRHPGAEVPEEIEPPDGNNCALDYAARGGMTLEEVGDVLGITRERVRQIEESAVKQVHRSVRRGGEEAVRLKALNECGPPPRPDVLLGGVALDPGIAGLLTPGAERPRQRKGS